MMPVGTSTLTCQETHGSRVACPTRPTERCSGHLVPSPHARSAELYDSGAFRARCCLASRPPIARRLGRRRGHRRLWPLGVLTVRVDAHPRHHDDAHEQKSQNEDSISRHDTPPRRFGKRSEPTWLSEDRRRRSAAGTTEHERRTAASIMPRRGAASRTGSSDGPEANKNACPNTLDTFPTGRDSASTDTGFGRKVLNGGVVG